MNRPHRFHEAGATATILGRNDWLRWFLVGYFGNLGS